MPGKSTQNDTKQQVKPPEPRKPQPRCQESWPSAEPPSPSDQASPPGSTPLDEGRRPAGLTDQQGDAAIAKIILGGGSNARDLADLATLIGERDDHTLAVSRGSYGEKSTRSKPRTMSNCSRRCCSSAPSSSS